MSILQTQYNFSSWTRKAHSAALFYKSCNWSALGAGDSQRTLKDLILIKFKNKLRNQAQCPCINFREAVLSRNQYTCFNFNSTWASTLVIRKLQHQSKNMKNLKESFSQGMISTYPNIGFICNNDL